MDTILAVSITDIIAGILIIGFCIPLIFEKIPMNHYYGVRFKTSFKSDESWYAINKYGAKCLLYATLPVFTYGIIGILLYKKLGEWYLWVGLVDMFVFIGFALLAAYWKAQEIDRQTPLEQ